MTPTMIHYDRQELELEYAWLLSGYPNSTISTNDKLSHLYCTPERFTVKNHCDNLLAKIEFDLL